MAIINCRECGSSISEFAKICPSCGIKDPSLTKALRWGGELSQLIGIVLMVVGVFVWAILPLIFALPVLLVGIFMFFAPQLGFILLAGLVIYLLLGALLSDLNAILYNARAAIRGSGFLDLLKYVAPFVAGIGYWYDHYKKSIAIDPVACVLQKPSLASIQKGYVGTFQELVVRVKAVKHDLNFNINLIDVDKNLIVISDLSKIYWSGFVYSVKINQMNNIEICVYSKVGNREGFMFAKKSLKKLTDKLFRKMLLR